MNEEKRVLITGGAGYIGRNLYEYLDGVGGLFIRTIDKKTCQDVINYEKVWRHDCIVHLGAMSGIVDCRDFPEMAIKDNITATLKLMQLCCKYEVPLIFASSGAAPTPYESLYAMSKYIGEVEARRLMLHGGKINILRFSNVYGGKYWEEKSSVIPLFLNANAKGEKLIINGVNGNQKRDFIHVKDVCRAIWKVMNSSIRTTKPVYIASGKQTSILEIAEMLVGKNGYIFNPTSDIVGVDKVDVDVDDAEKLFGFTAKESLENYLEDV